MSPSDDIWAALITEAQNISPCTSLSATCRVICNASSLYAVFFHSDDELHSCVVCDPPRLPELIISVTTWQTQRHATLVARVARWLEHCHQGLADSDVGAALDAAAAGDGRLGVGDTDLTAGTTASSSAVTSNPTAAPDAGR